MRQTVIDRVRFSKYYVAFILFCSFNSILVLVALQTYDPPLYRLLYLFNHSLCNDRCIICAFVSLVGGGGVEDLFE